MPKQVISLLTVLYQLIKDEKQFREMAEWFKLNSSF